MSVRPIPLNEQYSHHFPCRNGRRCGPLFTERAATPSPGWSSLSTKTVRRWRTLRSRSGRAASRRTKRSSSCATAYGCHRPTMKAAPKTADPSWWRPQKKSFCLLRRSPSWRAGPRHCVRQLSQYVDGAYIRHGDMSDQVTHSFSNTSQMEILILHLTDSKHILKEMLYLKMPAYYSVFTG